MSADFNTSELIRVSKNPADGELPFCSICLDSSIEDTEEKAKGVADQVFLGHKASATIEHLCHEKCFREWDQVDRSCPLCKTKIEDRLGILPHRETDPFENFELGDEEVMPRALTEEDVGLLIALFFVLASTSILLNFIENLVM